MRYTEGEIAEVLAVVRSTVIRDWANASEPIDRYCDRRNWLLRSIASSKTRSVTLKTSVLLNVGFCAVLERAGRLR